MRENGAPHFFVRAIFPSRENNRADTQFPFSPIEEGEREMYSREENVITCVPGKFPGECRPMLLRRKNRARGPVPSLRIDERIKTFPPELSSFRRGKGFRRICFVPARSILETRQGTKGKSSGIRGRERGEKEGKVVYLFGTQVPRAGSFRMIMIFKLKISGRGLTRISAAAATFQRSVRSPEKRDCPSISARRCIFRRRRPVTGDIWFYRQLGSAVSRCGDTRYTRDTLLRAHLSRTRNIIPARRTPFRSRLRNDDRRKA